ncbi:MAG: MbnP family protein [Bacteroidota bacterium]
MLHSNYIRTLFLVLIAAMLWSCDNDKDEATTGTFDLIFDNVFGDGELALVAEDDDTFMYQNASGQAFNANLLGYYVSKIELEGPNGEYYADEVSTGAKAEDVKGFYQVLESEVSTQSIRLEGVPVGKYDRVVFTLGIDAETVQEGATGGVLDPAEGAWLWNWDAGYIGFAFEGRSPLSPEEESQWNPANAVQLHLGGWKDIPDNPNMVNNVKRIELAFPASVNVDERLEPSAHIEMDLQKVLGDIDFSTTFSVHAPAAGVPFANNLPHAFIVHHVHQ